MEPTPGPTGEFPQGAPLAANDRGGLYAAISVQNGLLRMDFGTSLTFLLATKAEAKMLIAEIQKRLELLQ